MNVLEVKNKIEEMGIIDGEQNYGSWLDVNCCATWTKEHTDKKKKKIYCRCPACGATYSCRPIKSFQCRSVISDAAGNEVYCNGTVWCGG